MFDKAEYLSVGKRSETCAQCGASLLDTDRHPSVLVDAEDCPIETTAETSAKVVEIEEKPNEGGEESELGTPEEPQTEAAPEQAGETTDDETLPDAPSPRASDDDEGFHRHDYCPVCWQRMKDDAWFSFWIGRRNPSDLPKKKLNRTERNLALAALFDSLAERDDENDYSPHLFFIAHLLMKYKVFKWSPSVRDEKTGQEMIRFLRVGIDPEEEVLIPDMEMTDETILRVKTEVEEYLEETTGQTVQL